MYKKTLVLIQNIFNKTVDYPVSSLVIFRLIFGFYLLHYYVMTLPFAHEIYSDVGVISDVSLNWTYGIFPNILNLFDSPLAITLVFSLGIILSLALLLGIFPRISSLSLWYLQTALYNRNVLTDEPSMAYTGLLLITLALLPRTDSLISYLNSLKDYSGRVIKIPYLVFFAPIFVFALTFTISGIDKIIAVSWLNGNALLMLLNLELARENIITTFLLNHPTLTSILSHVALLSQIISLPLFLIGLYKVVLYTQLVAFIFAFLALILNQVTLGIIMFLLFFIMQNNDLKYLIYENQKISRFIRWVLFNVRKI